MPVGLPHPHLAVRRFNSYRFLWLLLALLLLLLATPFVQNDLIDRAILGCLFTIVLFAAGRAASAQRHERWLLGRAGDGEQRRHRRRPAAQAPGNLCPGWRC